MHQQRVVAVIFAGGSGKRLWPLSTQETPKQINHTFSKDSMLVDTYRRALKFSPKNNIVVVTTQQLLQATKELLPLEDKNIIVQPKNADTAAAMCVAAMYLETIFPESVAVYLYSDQFINDDQGFGQAVHGAVGAASNNSMVIIGTKPAFANTEFGYIKMGQEYAPHIFEVAGFKEKPESSEAKRLVANRQWLWNTGIKVWRISALLGAIKAASPDMYRMLLDLRTEIGGPGYWRKLEDWYGSIESASFESTIAAKLPRLRVLEADYYWEDIGNWQTVYKLAGKDTAGNAIKVHDGGAPVKLLDTKNSLVVTTTSQKIALINMDDIIVVQTKDALLICRKEVAARIKEVAE